MDNEPDDVYEGRRQRSRSATETYHDYGIGIGEITQDLSSLRDNPEISEAVAGLLDIVLAQLASRYTTFPAADSNALSEAIKSGSKSIIQE